MKLIIKEDNNKINILIKKWKKTYLNIGVKKRRCLYQAPVVSVIKGKNIFRKELKLWKNIKK